MDLRSLKYFIAVYENTSFSGAAKKCYVAQPSISNAVAHLEELLATQLFTRHARGVKPTAQGEKLYPLAKKLLGQAHAIKQVFTEQPDKPDFKLGVTKGLGVKRMSALLKAFTASSPNMALTLVPPTDDCHARIITKEELTTQERFVHIWQEDYLLAMPYHHPLSLKTSISMDDFDNLAMIQRTPCNAWRIFEEVLALAGKSVDIRANIQTIDYALGLVSADLGCAIVPAYKEVLAHKDIVFKPIEEVQLRREIVLAYTDESSTINKLKQVIN